MKPVINKELCNDCSACEEVCPVMHFKKVKGKMTVVKPEQECIKCRACEYACSNKAITLKE